MNNQTEETDWVTPQTPLQELVATALHIASIPENTRFRNDYRKFLKNIAGYDRDIERTKDFNFVYYVDGNVVTQGRGQNSSKKSTHKTKPNRKKRSSKGFE